MIFLGFCFCLSYWMCTRNYQSNIIFSKQSQHTIQLHPLWWPSLPFLTTSSVHDSKYFIRTYETVIKIIHNKTENLYDQRRFLCSMLIFT